MIKVPAGIDTISMVVSGVSLLLELAALEQAANRPASTHGKRNCKVFFFITGSAFVLLVITVNIGEKSENCMEGVPGSAGL